MKRVQDVLILMTVSVWVKSIGYLRSLLDRVVNLMRIYI